MKGIIRSTLSIQENVPVAGDAVDIKNLHSKYLTPS